MQIMGACKNYIFDTDISPSRLRNLLIRRHCRAVSRKYGLEAFYSILEIMSGEDFSFLTTLSSTCCVQALMWLRPGLRGVSKTTKNVVQAHKTGVWVYKTGPWPTKHCPGPRTIVVQAHKTALQT